MKIIKLFTLFFSAFYLSSCMFHNNTVKVNVKKLLASPKSITSVAVMNNQIVIKGSGLSGVTSLKIQNNNLNETFAIESATASQVVANGVHAVAIGVGQVFNLILSSAEGSATFPVSFTLDNGSITAVMLSSMGASVGQVLKYNGTTWVPATIPSSQLYMGAWNANTNTPDPNAASPISGDYYIVTVAGTQNLGAGAVAYSVGDMVMYNGSSWDKLQNATVVNSFNGRSGVVVGIKGDYSLTKMSDVDLVTTPPVANQVLKYDGTNWVPGTVSAGGGGTVTNVSGTTPISVTNGTTTPAISISQANTTTNGYLSSADWNTFNNKESAITAGATSQYLRGDKSLSNFAGDVLATVLTGLSTATNAVIAATDSVLVSFGKLQAQITSLGSTKLDKTGGTLSVGTIDGVPAPVTANQIVNKAYVDGFGQWVKTGSNIYFNTGKVGIGIAAPTTAAEINGTLTLDGSTSGTVALRAPASGGTATFVLPAGTGTSGQVLTTDGTGALSWTTASGSSSVPNWVEKASNYTASAGDHIFANTSAGSFTITLPVSPTANDTIQIVDNSQYFSAHALTIDFNGIKLSGQIITTWPQTTPGETITLTYQNSTIGWVVTNYGSVLTPYTATNWNPSDKGATILLSNNNFDAISSSGSWNTVRATTSHSSGKYYFEIKAVAVSGGTPAGMFGMGNSSANLSSYLGSDSGGRGYQVQGTWTYGSTFTGSVPAFAAGDICGVAVDFTAGTLSIYKNNVYQGQFTSLPTGALFPAISLADFVTKLELHTDTPHQSYAPPSGFTAWD